MNFREAPGCTQQPHSVSIVDTGASGIRENTVISRESEDALVISGATCGFWRSPQSDSLADFSDIVTRAILNGDPESAIVVRPSSASSGSTANVRAARRVPGAVRQEMMRESFVLTRRMLDAPGSRRRNWPEDSVAETGAASRFTTSTGRPVRNQYVPALRPIR